MQDESFSETERIHRPVLLREVLDFLKCRKEGFYVDCTVGMGGHAERILEACAPTGTLLGLDRDEEAIRFSGKRLARFKNRVKLVQEDYRMLPEVLQSSPQANGILADLGPSLLQFTSAHRGFSFLLPGPLDMRMDRRQDLTAADIVNRYSYEELARLIRVYGEESGAKKIARAIIAGRQTSPIQTTEKLRQIIETVRKRRPGEKIHPATKTFQALRIAVNSELEGLDSFVFDAFDSLATEGRLVVIAFHSLEDRIIKRTFQFLSAACRCPKRYHQCCCGGEPLSKLLTKRPAKPAQEEIRENPASRSAKLRCIEKIRGPVPRHLWEEWQRERRI